VSDGFGKGLLVTDFERIGPHFAKTRVSF
jgi:hypothetical protein